MSRFPAHVPILTCDLKGRDRWLLRILEALEKRNVRIARITATDDFTEDLVVRLLLDNHLVLVDKHICPQVSGSLTGINDIVLGSDPQTAADQIVSWATDCSKQTPLAGAVLIGGKSSRMGRPKHLISGIDGQSWLQHLIRTFEPFVVKQVISGAGALPGEMVLFERLDDLAGVQGPLAGIGALLRSEPFGSWLVCACDMPYITPASIRWLLEQREPGYAAVIPENSQTGKHEPLFAWYDYRCRPLAEDLIASGSRKISDLCSHSSILRSCIPEFLAPCWRNINYPDQL